jgi:hypothetical protein
MLAEKGKITSLYDMLKSFEAGWFFSVGQQYENLSLRIEEILVHEERTESRKKHLGNLSPSEKRTAKVKAEAKIVKEHERLISEFMQHFDKLGRLFAPIEKRGPVFGLITAAKKAKELRDDIKKKRLLWPDVARGMRELNWIIKAELDSQHFLHVKDEGVVYLHEKFHVWHRIIDRPGMEIIEDEAHAAAWAMAFEDHTGSVFHLMRVMESGLRLIEKNFNRKAGSREWGRILNVIEGHFTHKYKVSNNSWEQREPEWAAILNSLRLMKDVWRNKFIHIGEMDVDTFYQPEKAKLIYDHVIDFMDRLSLHLNPLQP